MLAMPYHPPVESHPAFPFDPLGMVGQVLQGQFRLDAVVANRERSVTYRGYHLVLGVPVAVACMKPAPKDVHERLARQFRHDARLQYQVARANPHVVRVLAMGTALGESAGSPALPFVVLEWLEGRPLSEWLAERRAAGMRGQKLTSAMRLLAPVVEVLASTHEQGLVHRELRPDNLFVVRGEHSEHLKLLRFGAASELDPSAPHPTPSESAYAAPEQIEPELGSVGPWTDVYSIAMVLLELLRDQPVLEPGPPSIAAQVVDPARRPTPRSLGIAVGEVVEAAFAGAVTLHPNDRSRDAGRFWSSLEDAVRRAARNDVEEAPTQLVASPALGSALDHVSGGGAVERTTVMAMEDLQELRSKDGFLVPSPRASARSSTRRQTARTVPAVATARPAPPSVELPAARALPRSAHDMPVWSSYAPSPASPSSRVPSPPSPPRSSSRTLVILAVVVGIAAVMLAAVTAAWLAWGS